MNDLFNTHLSLKALYFWPFLQNDSFTMINTGWYCPTCHAPLQGAEDGSFLMCVYDAQTYHTSTDGQELQQLTLANADHQQALHFIASGKKTAALPIWMEGNIVSTTSVKQGINALHTSMRLAQAFPETSGTSKKQMHRLMLLVWSFLVLGSVWGAWRVSSWLLIPAFLCFIILLGAISIYRRMNHQEALRTRGGTILHGTIRNVRAVEDGRSGLLAVAVEVTAPGSNQPEIYNQWLCVDAAQQESLRVGSAWTMRWQESVKQGSSLFFDFPLKGWT